MSSALRNTVFQLSRSINKGRMRYRLLRNPSVLNIRTMRLGLNGINAPSEIKKALTSAVNELAATACRSTGALACTICSGAMETATKISPTNAPPAPALATKKLVNADGIIKLALPILPLHQAILVSPFSSRVHTRLFCRHLCVCPFLLPPQLSDPLQACTGYDSVEQPLAHCNNRSAHHLEVYPVVQGYLSMHQ